jgi:flagellar biosynthesis/type III secretory pathway protein FliH
MFHDNKTDGEYFHTVKLVDISTGAVFYDKSTLIYIEMPKFNKQESELTSRLDHWLYRLKHLEEMDAPPAEMDDPIFNRLFEAAEIAKLSKSELKAYQSSLKAYRDNYSTMKTAVEEGHKKGLAEGLEKGREEGREEGLAKGLKKGLTKGLKKGREEGLEKGEAIGMKKGLTKGEAKGLKKGREEGLAEGEAKMIRTLYNNGMSIEQIEIFCSLSREKILEIVNYTKKHEKEK